VVSCAAVRSRSPVLAWVASAVLLVVVAYPWMRDLVLQPETSPALRGRELAEELGCFGCHGPGGRGGVGNPGSKRKKIPPFTGSTLMMYVHDEQEIREYILDGRPKRLADDGDYAAEMKAQAIHMPAYRDVLAPGELDFLVAYIRQISGMIESPEGPARTGAEIADRLGCFGCHGALGMGGVENPGSLKGYVPGFMGADYRELVQSREELREWIREGRLRRVSEHWVGGRFAEGQLIQMPAYKDFLDEAELEALMAFVEWIASGAMAREPMS
jgi:mono/diheme cytochrome c family protein